MKLIHEGVFKKLVGLMLAIAVLVAMMPAVSFAATTGTTGGKSKVTLYRTDKIHGKWPGYVSEIVTNTTSGKFNISYGVKKKFTVKTYKGYYLVRVLVDGKNKGRVSSFTIKGDGKNHTIKADFAKATLKVKIDPGHAGYYNRGYSGTGYWESVQMWKLANYLTPRLNAFPGIEATKTKSKLYSDPQVYSRGKMAKGNDIFLSLHSNSSSSSKTDYPLAIVSYSKRQLYNVAQPLGKELAKMVKSTMATKQDYQVWVKKQSDGRDWYGVIRGSSDVGVPGIILEHSFHSNKSKAKWLLNNSNLINLANKEANIISKYYGFTKSGNLIKPGKAKDVSVSSKSSGTATIAWKKAPVTGYEVFRSTKAVGGYSKVTNTAARTFKDETAKSGSKYYYKVRTYRCNGKKISYSDMSTPKAVTIKW